MIHPDKRRLLAGLAVGILLSVASGEWWVGVTFQFAYAGFLVWRTPMPRECGHQSPGQQYLPLGSCPLCDLDFALEAGDVARKTWRHRRAPLVQWMRENGRAGWPEMTLAELDRVDAAVAAAGYRPAPFLSAYDRCPVHLQPEPCEICSAYIAGGP